MKLIGIVFLFSGLAAAHTGTVIVDDTDWEDGKRMIQYTGDAARIMAKRIKGSPSKVGECESSKTITCCLDNVEVRRFTCIGFLNREGELEYDYRKD